MKKTINTVVLLFIFGISWGQEKINWISINELSDLMKTEQRSVIIDVYTSWCGYCKKMDAHTFNDSSVVKYINKHYYAVKLDAETTDSLTFRDHTFGKNQKYNDLSIVLLDGKMAFPSIVYLNKESLIVERAPGYNTPDQIIPHLKFTENEIYKQMTFEEFVKTN